MAWRNRQRAKQLISFDDLEMGGGIHPTDIDGVIEYHDRCWIWIEYKYGDAELPRGQQLMLERLCDELSKQKPTIVIIGEHHEADPEQDIKAGEAIVREIYYRGQWWLGKGTTTVAEAVKWFIAKGERDDN